VGYFFISIGLHILKESVPQLLAVMAAVFVIRYIVLKLLDRQQQRHK